MIAAEEADAGRAAAADVPADPRARASTAARRGHVLTMVREELRPARLQRGRDRRRRAAGHHHVHPEGDGRRRGGRRGGAARRVQRQGAAHRASPRVEPGTGAVRGIYGGQDYLESQINWAVAGRPGRLDLQAVRAGGRASRTASRSRTPSTATRRSSCPTAPTSRTRATRATATAPVTLIKATENSINTAFIDMTDVMDDGPEKIVDAASRLGIPPGTERNGPGFPTTRPGWSRSPAWRSARDRQPDQHGQRVRHASPTAARAAEPYIIEKVVDRERRDALPAQGQRTSEAVDRGHRRRRRPTRCSRSSTNGTGHGRAGARPARPPARPAPRPTATARSSSAWFVGYTPQLAPRSCTSAARATSSSRAGCRRTSAAPTRPRPGPP